MRGALLQIGRTALLCGALGLGLYFLVAEAALYQELFISLLGMAAAGSLSALLVREIREGLLTGIVPRLPRAIQREAEPVWFWGSLIFSALCLLMLLWLFAASLTRLLNHLAGGS